MQLYMKHSIYMYIYMHVATDVRDIGTDGDIDMKKSLRPVSTQDPFSQTEENAKKNC